MDNGKMEIVIDSYDMEKIGFHGIKEDVFLSVTSFAEEIFTRLQAAHKNYDFIVFEVVKNAVDAILDRFYQLEPGAYMLGRVEIKFYLDKTKKLINFFVTDNGAGTNASSTSQKSDCAYFGGQGYGELSVRNITTKYKRVTTPKGSVVQFQFAV